MVQSLPTVSIVLAIYNEETHIEEAISSIFKAYDNSSAAGRYAIEVVAVDDFSTDRTVEIMQAMDFPGLRVLKNETKGKVHAYNLAMSQSTGDFVVLFAGDDVFNMDSIVPRIDPIRDQDGPAISLCALQAFVSDMSNLAQRFPRVGGGARAGGAIAMNRAFVDLCMPIPIDMPNEDTWICLHADFLNTYTVDVDVIGLWYRLHEGNSSGYGAAEAVQQRNKLLNRSLVYGIFEHKWESRMSESNQKAISREVAAHSLARSGNALSILFLAGYPLGRRLRALALSKVFLWKIRVGLGARVSGLVGS